MHLEAIVRFLTTEEGGRRTPVRSGYSAQFHLDGQDWSVHLTFPDLQPREQIILGNIFRTSLNFFVDPERLASKLSIGTQFKIKEGARIVAVGEIIQRGDNEVSQN